VIYNLNLKLGVLRWCHKFIPTKSSAHTENELLRNTTQMSNAKEVIISNSEHHCQRGLHCILA